MIVTTWTKRGWSSVIRGNASHHPRDVAVALGTQQLPDPEHKNSSACRAKEKTQMMNFGRVIGVGGNYSTLELVCSF